jgi:hypothetical protein
MCFGLTSCQVFEKSEIWDAVTHVTPGDAIRDPDPSAAYSVKLHRVLLEQGVEHFVVTYQFHYFTHQRDEAVDTRTAVVYRDPVSSAYPWWLKDERSATPVWLPNGDLAAQISFYIRRPAQVIDQKHFAAGAKSGKATLGMFQPADVKPRSVFADHPQHAVTRITQTRSTPAPAKKPVLTFQPVVSKPALTSAPAKDPALTFQPVASKPATTTTPARNPELTFQPISSKPAVTTPAPVSIIKKIEHAPRVAEAKPKAAPNPETLHAAPLGSSPTVQDSATQALEPVSRDEQFEKIFRAHNGTAYDPSSAMDRRKMDQLKQGFVGREADRERPAKRELDTTAIGF